MARGTVPTSFSVAEFYEKVYHLSQFFGGLSP